MYTNYENENQTFTLSKLERIKISLFHEQEWTNNSISWIDTDRNG